MSACKTCQKTSPEVTLKKCAKCQTASYCSRDCQKADWKTHKKTCDKPPTANPALPLNPPKGLSGPITAPFTRLEKGTWLHDRPEKDVFTLLIDAYRMRVEDMYTMEGEVDEDSIYSGSGTDGVVGFRKFLTKVERYKGGALLPAWWSEEKREACVAFGRAGGGEDGWAGLRFAVEKSDMNEHYGDPLFAMQLRMFAEFVYGRGPGGADGTGMRRMMATMEQSGAAVQTTSMSL